MRGAGEDANPYERDNLEWEAWLDGWEHAKEVAEIAEPADAKKESDDRPAPAEEINTPRSARQASTQKEKTRRPEPAPPLAPAGLPTQQVDASMAWRS